jgi:hypothetical protein
MGPALEGELSWLGLKGALVDPALDAALARFAETVSSSS